MALAFKTPSLDSKELKGGDPCSLQERSKASLDRTALICLSLSLTHAPTPTPTHDKTHPRLALRQLSGVTTMKILGIY